MNLKEILKLIGQIKAKGKRTAEELKSLKGAVAKMSDENKEAVAEDVSEIEALPEEGGEADAEQAVKSLFERVAKGIKEDLNTEVKGIKEEVKNYLEKTLDSRKNKTGVYADEVKEKRTRLNAKMGATLKALILRDEKAMDSLKAKEMTTDATGTPFTGYVVDSELSAEIRHLVTTYGVARREFTTLTLTKNGYKANELVTDVSVSWVDEASAIGSTQFVLGQNPLTLKKLAAIVTFTNELLLDEEIDLMDFAATRVAEAIAGAEDAAYFKGDGTSTYGSFTGLLNKSTVPEVVMTGTTFASLDADDLLDLIDKVPQGAQANGKFYMHRTIMSIVRKLKESTTNAYIYQAPSQTGPATIWGKPVVEVEAMPTSTNTAADTSFVLYGDLKKAAIMGIGKEGLRAEVFDAGIVRNVAGNADINLITTDRKAMRFVERTGYVSVLENAVARLTTAAASA